MYLTRELNPDRSLQRDNSHWRDDRLAVINQALRELSGVNGLLIGEWLRSHADEVISHNSKYGMQNLKDLL